MARIIYSSGVIENHRGSNPFEVRRAKLRPLSRTVWVHVFNNNRGPVTVKTRFYSLDNFKRKLGPRSSGILNGKSLNVDTLPSATSFWYEVQVEIEAKTLKQAKNVIISMFPKGFDGRLLASQRLVHTEFKIISIKN